MKIRTITCHDVGNYGASLQAYALTRYLQNLGHDVKIIDYLPGYKAPCHSLSTFYNSGYAAKVYRYAPYLKPFMALWQNRHELRFQGRRRAFEKFKAERLTTTATTYHDNSELEHGMVTDSDLKADLCIAGSDQIWNPYYGNGLDPAYYCAFVKDPSRCISYAASFGKNDFTDAEWQFIKASLVNFRALSVREKTGVEIVRRMGYDAVLTADPVFLISLKEWEDICVEPEIEGYVLVYDFLHNDPAIGALARNIARKRGLRIVAVNDKGRASYADKNISDAGPAEFLGYIRRAEHVIASSFHAAAFSTIFERDFYIFPLKGHGNSSRMVDFLNLTGLSDRFMSGNTVHRSEKINFSRAKAALGRLADESKRWLERQIENVNVTSTWK